jgi:hypothetical protein
MLAGAPKGGWLAHSERPSGFYEWAVSEGVLWVD